MATSYGGNGKLGTNMQQWEKQGNQRFIIRKIGTVDENVFRPTMIHANEDAEDVFTGFKMLEEYLHHRNGPSKHGSYFPYQLPSQDSGKVITKIVYQPSTVVDKHPVLYTNKSGEMKDLHKIGCKSHSNDTSDDDDDNDDDSHDGSNDDDEDDDDDNDDDSQDGSNDDDEDDDDDDDGSSEENDTGKDDGAPKRKNCVARGGFYNANGFNPGKSKKRGVLGIKYYVLGFNRRKQGY